MRLCDNIKVCCYETTWARNMVNTAHLNEDMLIEDIKYIKEKTGIGVIYTEKAICIISNITIPDHYGVYIITTESGRRYVGSSINIFRRLSSYKCGQVYKRKGEEIKSIGAYLTEEEFQARILEEWFIRHIKPELNKRMYKRSYNSKTTFLSNDTHKCLKKTQTMLYEKYDIGMTIPDIIENVVKNYEHVINIIIENKGISNVPIIEKEDTIDYR